MPTLIHNVIIILFVRILQKIRQWFVLLRADLEIVE
jgi:hypothetical protein